MTIEASPTSAEGTEAAPVLLAVRSVTKRYGTNLANDTIDLDIRPGEVLALLGDNGAGKSTLLCILCGEAAADTGGVLMANAKGRLQPLRRGSPRAAIAAGIGWVSRNLELAERLTGLENIVLGTQSLLRLRLSRYAARRRLRDLMSRLTLRVDLDTRVSGLSMGERVRVVILRALYRGVRVLVLDEPSASLTPQENESLFITLKTLAREGVAVIVSTRKIEEALELADRIVVLFEGRKVADHPATTQGPGALSLLMYGRVISRARPSYRTAGEELLELRKVSVRGDDIRSSLREASLTLHAGEIVGIAGIAGNGQDALAAVAAGLRTPTSGEVLLFGRRLRRLSPTTFIRAGVGRIADAQHDGLVPTMSVAENLAIEDVRTAFTRFGLLRTDAMRQHAHDMTGFYSIECPGPQAPIGTLSRSAMQRLVFVRMLDREPRIIIANQPTRGLNFSDGGEILRQLIAARDAGAGILLITDDLDELLNMSDLIGVLHRGHLTQPQPTGAFDTNTLGFMMGGHGSLAQDWAGWG